MALVQSCTHAFQHKEGWMSSMPSTGTRIVSAEDGYKGGKAGGFYSDRSDLVQKFDVSCRMDDQSKSAQPSMLAIAGPGAPTGKIVPMIPMNPPGAPVPMAGGYFADWSSYGGQPMMIVPNSPFYPGAEQMEQMKKKHKKKKNKKSKKKSTESDEEEEETYFVKRSDLLNHKGDSLRARMKSTPGGDSLRSRIKGGHSHHGGVFVEEIIQPSKPCPPVVVAQKPCPPQIILVPQPPAQPPAQPPTQPAAPANGP